ncbi:DUF1254 domain-containing protein [Crenothrix polyspora]|uniref:DUF1254 domain-containing protein n=1 Tax=Crenothrix polyspora TaxID=360316 RepID=A0A1R4H2E6_9GAMM|nr:DUF1254 domain-containing protein [Crenothrix polyspora]SJM90417.1 conserved exported hypothetical protein [Crenothrix polyspora]
MKYLPKSVLLISAVVFIFTACSSNQLNTQGSLSSEIPADSIPSIAGKAYIFGLPLVIMDLTKQEVLKKTPVNTFRHIRAFPDADFRAVVRPNADTYYSTAELDLLNEPLVLSVPNTHGRYYLLPILDAYTNVINSPGARTTGTEAKNFLITGPAWKGTVPPKMQHIASPTNMAWIIGRTQVNSKEDGENVVYKIQDGFKLMPLSTWGKHIVPPVLDLATIPKGENINKIVSKMPIDSFFNYMNRLMLENPPAATDKKAMEAFAKIGVSPGATFNLENFNFITRFKLKKIPEVVFSKLDPTKITAKRVNGWRVTTGKPIGFYGTDYPIRAFISLYGLGANLPADAIYPSCETDEAGMPLTGANSYMIHFEKGQLPPVKAFWSISLYDKEGFFIHNPIHRYAIGDRDKLNFNSDGSLDIFIQTVSPGKDNNWLPAPKDNFSLTIRLFWPTEDALKGKWTPPSVKKNNS